MDWRTFIGLASGVAVVLSIIPYIRDMRNGLSRPNLVTWSIWTLNGVILAAAQFQAGASWTLSVLIASTVTTAMVSILSVRYGQRQYGVLDGVCLIMALLAICGWRLTNDPLTAIVLGVVAEIFAVSPTIAKTIRDPASETPITYWVTSLATVASIVASTKFDVANLLFPAYSIIVNTWIAVMATAGRRVWRRH